MKLIDRLSNYKYFALFLYLTLIAGFLYDENLNFGSYYDWVNAYNSPIKDFSENFTKTLLNYDQYGQRHSPLYLIILSLFLDLNFSFDQIRFIHLHISLSLIWIFYNCLKLKFHNIDKKYLQLLSLVIFLSPTFRSLSIWPDSRLPGLILFTTSIYYFLKFERFYSIKYAWFSTLSLIISAYVSPNFSVFFLYYFFFFFKGLKYKDLLILCSFIFLAGLPAIYYIFYLEINFLFSNSFDTNNIDRNSIFLKFNFADKILIISTIIFFHIIPILSLKEIHNKFFAYIKKNIKKILIPLFFLFYFFAYKFFTGGGIFFQLSNLLFDNNYLFFIICFFSFSFIMYISKLSIDNLFLIFLIIVSNIQYSIYHKYYEPMILIIFFTLIKNLDLKFFFKDKKGLIYLYLFCFLYVLARIFKIFFLE
jgi:hypothetical protein